MTPWTLIALATLAVLCCIAACALVAEARQ